VAYQHEQEEQDLLQQYGDVFFQQSHSADVHGDRTYGERYPVFGSVIEERHTRPLHRIGQLEFFYQICVQRGFEKRQRQQQHQIYV
jgi:hypothetical protein